MTLKLVVTTNVNGDVFDLVLKNARYGVGRRHDNDLRIKETYISGYHAELIRSESGEYALSDLGSSNGTFLNGRRLDGKEIVRAGDFIKFGILKVAVQEHKDTMPKIVPLKDRLAFSPKDKSNTAALAPEKKTGPLSAVAAIQAKGETQATPLSDSSAARLAELEGQLGKDKIKRAALERDVEVLRRDLAARDSELKSLAATAAAKSAAEEGDLKATEREVAKISILTAELVSLRSELDETKSKVASEVTEKSSLESALAGKAGELKVLQARIDELTVTAEKEKSGLAAELAVATLAATTIKSEFSKLSDESAAARKEREQQIEELEKEKTRLGKTLESLETKFARKDEELSALKTALAEKDKAVLSADSEAKEAAKRLAELEPVKTDLEAARNELAETSRRLGKLESEHRAGLLEKEKLNDELTTRLRSVEENAGTEIATLTAELEKARIEISDKASAAERESTKWQGEIATLTAEVAESLTQIAVTSRQLDEAQRLVGSSEIERASLRSELGEFQKRAASAGEESSAIRARLDAIEAERDELNGRIKAQINDLQAAKAEANALRIELKKTREDSESFLQQTEQSLRSRIAELETSLAAERVLAGDTLSQKSSLESSLEGLRKNHETLTEEIAQLKSRNEEISRNSGRIQAELNRETAERSQIAEELEASRGRAGQLVKEVDDLRRSLEGKDRELAEREQQFSRSESDTVQKLKRELGEAVVARAAAEELSSKANREKLSLSGAYERLRERLDLAESANRKAKEAEEELNHGKGLLARRLEKAEASNSELAARIKEEAFSLIANRDLIAKLEQQLRENESEAVRREQEQVASLRADLGQMKIRFSDEERQRGELAAELTRTREAKRLAEERILELDERLLERESETVSTRVLLTETEKKRGELAARLTEETALAATRARDLDTLRKELANTISRFEASELELLSKHGNEIDDFLAELRNEREQRERLESELSNTRIGMSDALRKVREESAVAQARLITEGNARLSAVEDNLSEVIRSCEEIERSRNNLEDELNRRDEEIEKHSERIEDLEIQLRDEIEARDIILKNLETTKAGFSKVLRANWGHLGTARVSLEKEKAKRETSEVSLTAARGEIDRLIAAAGEQDLRYRSEIRDWEIRYNTLREEKLTLASEDANLDKIREQIQEASAKKRGIETEIGGLGSELKDFRQRHRELQVQKDSLLRDREELKAGLNAARSELDSVQRRFNESKEREAKLTDTITTAERRIQSLRKLESEMEQVVERKRQQNILSRGDIFSEQVEVLTTNGDFSREDFYRKLIAKLDLLDDLTKRYDNKWRYPKVAEQLSILKRSFVEFLHDHSVKQFDLEPGTVLSIAERRRIKLVPLQNGAPKKPGTNGSETNSSQKAFVVETLRPGYVYQDGAKDVIIRKAEVLVS